MTSARSRLRLNALESHVDSARTRLDPLLRRLVGVPSGGFAATRPSLPPGIRLARISGHPPAPAPIITSKRPASAPPRAHRSRDIRRIVPANHLLASGRVAEATAMVRGCRAPGPVGDRGCRRARGWSCPACRLMVVAAGSARGLCQSMSVGRWPSAAWAGGRICTAGARPCGGSAEMPSRTWRRLAPR